MAYPVAPLALAAALGWVLPGVVCAQEVSTVPVRREPAVVFKAGVEVVTLTAAVRDGTGRVVRDLRRADFEVLDRGIARDISSFHAGDAPISLAVLLDISGSMAVGGNIDRARSAVSVATSMLNSTDDEAALFTFDAKLQEVVSFTNDVDAVRRVSLEGQPWGMTSLVRCHRGRRETCSRARESASRAARDHGRRGYRQQLERSRGIRVCEFDRRAGVRAGGCHAAGPPGW